MNHDSFKNLLFGTMKMDIRGCWHLESM